MTAISDLLQGCLSQLTSLIDSDILSDHTEVPLQEWTDELGRLRVWAANLGAHQTRQSSLDYRLRDASHIKSQIIRLLTHVQELLTDLEDVLEEDSDDEAQDDRLEAMGDISGKESPTEIQEIHQSLVETITQLYQMSMIIRNPAQHDRLVGTDKVDSEPFQFWAKQHTSTKYPNADALAIDRISYAMARQRAILKYRERHHAKLSQGIDLEGDAKSTMLSETVVTDVFQEMQGECSDMVSDTGISETSYGGTLLEGTGVDAPKIPPIPKKGAEQRPFECPYCFYIITVRDRRAWARHIFRDLMPYVCIFPGCSTPNKLYDGRRQWYHHIQQAHNSNIMSGTYGCFICRQDSLPNTTFQRHVGQHLEELALFLLPRNDSNEDENVVPDGESSPESSDAGLSDAGLDHTPVEETVEQHEDVANAAIPASNPDIGNGQFSGLREKDEHHRYSAGMSLRGREIPGVVEHDPALERPVSTSPYEHGFDHTNIDQRLLKRLDSDQAAELLRQEIELLERKLANIRGVAEPYNPGSPQLPQNNKEYEYITSDQVETSETVADGAILGMTQNREENQQRDSLKKEIIEEEGRHERDKITAKITEQERSMAAATEQETKRKERMGIDLTAEDHSHSEEQIQTARPHGPHVIECQWEGCHGFRFQRAGDLVRHLRNTHLVPNAYTCHCGKAFNREDNLREHQRRRHHIEA